LQAIAKKKNVESANSAKSIRVDPINLFFYTFPSQGQAQVIRHSTYSRRRRRRKNKLLNEQKITET
jgi:hypothetical protein